MKTKLPCSILLMLLALPAVVQAQFDYTTNHGAITITEYTGPGGAVVIPGSTNGYPVTSIGDQAFEFGQGDEVTSVIIPNSVTNIGDNAFYYCYNLAGVTMGSGVTSIGNQAFFECDSLASVTIPDSVTNIGYDAFEFCASLTGIYFQGSAPGVGQYVFDDDNEATAYYLPGTTGWDDFYTNTDLPTVLWNPQVLTSDPLFGVRNGRFGFNITGTSNIVVAVEAATNLANPDWTPLTTNTLTSGSSYFSDLQWTNYSRRFYRLSSP